MDGQTKAIAIFRGSPEVQAIQVTNENRIEVNNWLNGLGIQALKEDSVGEFVTLDGKRHTPGFYHDDKWGELVVRAQDRNTYHVRHGDYLARYFPNTTVFCIRREFFEEFYTVISD